MYLLLISSICTETSLEDHDVLPQELHAKEPETVSPSQAITCLDGPDQQEVTEERLILSEKN